MSVQAADSFIVKVNKMFNLQVNLTEHDFKIPLKLIYAFIRI